MRRSSHSSSSTSHTASRVLQEGSEFCDQALAMMQQVVVVHEQDALSQTRHLNNLLLQVRAPWQRVHRQHAHQGFGQVPVATLEEPKPAEPSDSDSDLPPDDAVSSVTDDTIESSNDNVDISAEPAPPLAATSQADADPYTPAQHAAAKRIQHSWRRYHHTGGTIEQG